MSKKESPLIVLNNQMMQEMASKYSNSQNYFGKELAFITNFNNIRHDIMPDQPFQFKETRLIYIQKGISIVKINMMEYELKAGMLFVIPVNSIFSLVSMSEDYTPMIMACCVPLAEIGIMFEVIALQLSEEDRLLVELFFALANKLSTARSPKDKAMEYLFYSLFRFSADLHRTISNIVAKGKKKSASEDIRNNFMRLVMEEGNTRHDISFYADKLQVTANYLSIVVKKESSNTVAYWCNQRLILEAQMLLNAKQKLTLSAVADMLGFHNAAQFGTFFKKHTGKTPMEYRNGKEIPLGEAEEKINS